MRIRGRDFVAVGFEDLRLLEYQARLVLKELLGPSLGSRDASFDIDFLWEASSFVIRINGTVKAGIICRCPAGITCEDWIRILFDRLETCLLISGRFGAKEVGGDVGKKILTINVERI
jgi:hypothetical protein